MDFKIIWSDAAIADLWWLTANLSRIAEWPAAGEYARAKSLAEQRPFGRSQTPKSDPLRQPALHLRALDFAENDSRNEYNTGNALGHKGCMDWNTLVMDGV